MFRIRAILLALLLLTIPASVTQAAAILAENARGQEVVRLQKELIRTGYLKEGADGIFGAATKAAVIAFQRDAKLDATGVVNRDTWQRLRLAKTKTSSTSNANIAINPASKKKNTAHPPAPQENHAETTTSPATEKESKPTEPKTTEVTPAKKTTKTSKTGIQKNAYEIKKLPPGKSVAYHQTFFDKKSVSKLITTAKKYIGVPYQFGGDTPKAFDCSGYLQYVFQENGFAIPRLADEQYKLGRSTKTKKDLEPGDLVFFETYEKGASHCGIYLGKDEFIHASTSKGVRIDKLTDAYWKTRYYGGKKILQ